MISPQDILIDILAAWILAYRIVKSFLHFLIPHWLIGKATGTECLHRFEMKFALQNLSEELIFWSLKSLDAEELAQCSMSSNTLKRLCKDIPGTKLPGAISLAQLHLHETVGKLGRDDDLVCSYFRTASFMLVRKSGVKAAALLMTRHPQMTCQIDGHVHIGAPDQVAVHYSKMRAKAVRKRLVALGISADRISITSWGKDVAIKEGWDPIPHYSRAELTFCLSGKQFPPRRVACEESEPPEDAELTDDDDDDADGMLSDDDDASVSEDDDESDDEAIIQFSNGLSIPLRLIQTLVWSGLLQPAPSGEVSEQAVMEALQAATAAAGGGGA